MSTTKTYNSITDWNDTDVHLTDINIGPQGDVPHGQASIKGDRWRHKRIGYAEAPYGRILSDVESAAIQAPYKDNTEASGATYIHILRTKGFNDNETIYIEDLDGNETATIVAVISNQSLQISGSLDNSYSRDRNYFVSTIQEIHIEKTDGFYAGDYVEITQPKGGNRSVVKIYAVDPDGEDDNETVLQVLRLPKEYREDDIVSVINTSSQWSRDEKNPIVILQRKNWWDYAGQNIKAPEIHLSVDIQEDSEENIISEKHGMWIGADREEDSSQIAMLLSKDKDNIYNWTDFLGAGNPQRPNPIVRHSHFKDRFDLQNYANATAMRKVWNTEDVTISVGLCQDDPTPDTAWMYADYTGSGEVWGLMPTPINADITTNYNNEISFAYKGDASNTEGTLAVKLLAADGTSEVYDFADINLKESGWTTLTADISDFAGRKYLRAFVFQITSAGSGTVNFDDIVPFMPPRCDEIIEDPSVVLGTDEGSFAAYYTGRERPRQILTANASLDGNSSGTVTVGSTSDFDVGDIVVMYDRSAYEMGRVRTVTDATHLVVEHIGYTEDTTAEFENDYETADQAMIANNSYRVNKIYGSFVLSKFEDKSQWVKYSTNETPTAILEPETEGTCWDSLSVKQPNVKLFGNQVYMAYVGECSDNTPSIGFARSSDFVNFTKLRENPYIEPTASKFDSNGCFHPDLNVRSPFTFLNYSGYDGTRYNIGSAVQNYSFHNGKLDFHVALLVFPLSCEGYPPDNGSVLFDMGNFRIEVDSRNLVSAHAYVDGRWIRTKDEVDADIKMENAFGTFLEWDRWNLVIGQFAGNKLGIVNVKAVPEVSIHEYFTYSPWVLDSDASANSSSVTLLRRDATIDDVVADQDIMFWGYGVGDYSNLVVHQIGRIASVVDNGDDTYTCNLERPIGPWGFESDPLFDVPHNQGVLLAQGISGTCDDFFSWARNNRVEYLTPSTDTNKIFNITRVLGKGGIDKYGNEALEKTVGGEGETILDPDHALPPMVGNGYRLNPEEDKTQAWTGGYFGHVDIGYDILDPQATSTSGDYHDLYEEMINGGGLSKAQSHKLDLTGLGQVPAVGNMAGRWLLSDTTDNVKFPDSSPHNNHLYLTGTATTCDDCWLGKGIKMESPVTDNASAYLLGDDLTKSNSGDAQFEENKEFNLSDRWDNHGVSGSHLFKFNNKYRLAYTGEGKEPYAETGEIVGDLFETSLISLVNKDVTFSGTFYIPTGCQVKLYMSWTKKSNWVELYASSVGAGAVSWSDSFNLQDGITEYGSDISDYKYFVRWKLELLSNDDRDKSPIIKSWQVTYDEPESTPTAKFLAEQDKNTGHRVPVYRVVLWDSINKSDIDITSRVKQNGISNLTQSIPVTPGELGEIIASDVSIRVENTDYYFSENNDGTNSGYPVYSVASVFWDSTTGATRNYIEDEIRVYSGFVTADSLCDSVDGEFEVTGRFLINKVKVISDAEAIIECRSLLRKPLDTIVGEEVDGESDPLIKDGRVKDIMEELLTDYKDGNDKTIGAGLNPEDVFIEDFDREFGNIEISQMSVGEVLQKLAQACDGVVYTNNQGDVYFKTWANLCEGSYDIEGGTNLKRAQYTGQDYDRLVRSVSIGGEDNIQSTEEQPFLDMGRDISFDNEYLQRQSWADTIAEDIIDRYGLNESSFDLKTVYLPSVKILDTVQITEPVSGVTSEKYLVHNFVKNITLFKDDYNLVSNLAIDPSKEVAMATAIKTTDPSVLTRFGIFDNMFKVPVGNDLPHYMTHSGEHYVASEVVNVSTTTKKWIVTTPNTTKWGHAYFDIRCTGELSVTITEASDRDGVTAVDATNRQRNSVNTAGLTVYSGTSGGLTDGATTIFRQRDGATGIPGRVLIASGERGNNEFVLLQNTKYVVAVETFANVYVSFALDWYEHTSG